MKVGDYIKFESDNPCKFLFGKITAINKDGAEVDYDTEEEFQATLDLYGEPVLDFFCDLDNYELSKAVVIDINNY